MNLLQFVGFLGTGLVIVAYVPQIHHVIKEHCSAGISVRAYSLWFFASVLFLVHATMIKDLVFIIVQLVNLLAITIIVLCVKRFEKQMCRAHLETHLKQLQSHDGQQP